MESTTKDNTIDPLIERVQEYSKTSLELMKLKFIDKTSKVLSMMIFHFLLITVLSLFLFALNVAVALWLGEMLGKNYLGFLLVASFYAVVAIVLLFMSPTLKARIYNSVLTNILH